MEQRSLIHIYWRSSGFGYTNVALTLVDIDEDVPNRK